MIGELALGSLRDREDVLAFLEAQRQASVATHHEIMTMIERHRLFGVGIGYTDACLLASVMLERGSMLWTRDKRLGAAARIAGATLYPPISAAN